MGPEGGVLPPQRHHSNAPITVKSQSILSKKIARFISTIARAADARAISREVAYLSVALMKQRSALSGGPVDQACGIKQRCCLIEQLLGVESHLTPLFMKARAGAGIRRASYSCGLIKPVTDFS
jgi:hypothetical protein